MSNKKYLVKEEWLVGLCDYIRSVQYGSPEGDKIPFNEIMTTLKKALNGMYETGVADGKSQGSGVGYDAGYVEGYQRGYSDSQNGEPNLY